MDTVAQMAPVVGVVALCAALGLARATLYRRRRLLNPPPLATSSTKKTGGRSRMTVCGRTAEGATAPRTELALSVDGDAARSCAEPTASADNTGAPFDQHRARLNPLPVDGGAASSCAEPTAPADNTSAPSEQQRARLNPLYVDGGAASSCTEPTAPADSTGAPFDQQRARLNPLSIEGGAASTCAELTAPTDITGANLMASANITGTACDQQRAQLKPLYVDGDAASSCPELTAPADITGGPSDQRRARLNPLSVDGDAASSCAQPTAPAPATSASKPAGPASKTSPRALSQEERARVLAVLNEERFCNLAPAEIWATLLDEGTYLCSERTMYRVLEQNRQLRERRNQLRHPHYVAPELMAKKPNMLWSWDITKLKTFVKSQYLHLYVILDVYSRFVVGWMVAECEDGHLAKDLIDQTCERQAIKPGELTFHADNGAAMIAQPVAFLLASLGVTKSHSRPHVSDDNPFSESHFKTLKYRPDFPERFASLEHARAFLRAFFDWYNTQHHHDALALLTPHDVHHGLVSQRLEQRGRVLDAAYAAHPERFVNRPPAPAAPPQTVWINPPKPSAPTKETQA